MEVNFKVYQIGDGCPELMFGSFGNFVNSKQALIGLDSCVEVCEGTVETEGSASKDEILEKLFVYFNTGIGDNISVNQLEPMRSMSVSDIIALSMDGESFTYHYCDILGFVDCSRLVNSYKDHFSKSPCRQS